MSGSLVVLIEDGSTSLTVVVEDNPRVSDSIPVSEEADNQLVRNIDGYYVPPTAWDDIVDGPESSSSQVDDTVDQVPVLTNVVEQHTQQIEQLDQNKVENTDPRLSDDRVPTGPAGGVLSGTYPNPSFSEDMATSQDLVNGLSLKVDAVEGMGLSEENYTLAEKNKLSSLENYDDSNIILELSNKVDKEEGKGLSTNDFTNPLLEKLEGLDEGFAVQYVQTIDDLAQINPDSLEDGQSAQVVSTGRAGLFRWQSGDLSAEVAADPEHIFYVPSDGDDGGLGSWVRTSPFSVSDAVSRASATVDLANEIALISGQPDQMFVAKDSSDRLLVGYQRGRRMVQYRMGPDADGLWQMRSAKIGDAVRITGPTGRFNQVSLDGTFITSQQNSYTQTVGDTFSGEFSGEGLVFHYFGNDRGGVWRFVIDENFDNPIDVSTHHSPAVGITSQIVVDGLTDKNHVFIAEFIGDDPENPPSVSPSRGWLRYDASDPITIEDAGGFTALGFPATAVDAVLSGSYNSSGTNYYTVTPGDSFDFEFTGTALDFHHRGDNNGGVWSFVIDDGAPVEISTYSASAGVKTQTVVSGLPNVLHTGTATFIGDDPLNPPSSGTARGWLVYSPDEPITGTTAPRPTGSTMDMLAPTSVLEWAIRCRPHDAPGSITASWCPRHSGEANVTRDIDVRVLVDGEDVGVGLSGISTVYLPVRSVSVEQSYTSYTSTDAAGDYPMWEGDVAHEFFRDGRVRLSHRFETLRRLDCEVGYTHMLGATSLTNVINNGAQERFAVSAPDATVSYGSLYSGMRAEYRGEADRYMIAAQTLTPAQTWRFDGRDPVSYTNLRTDAVKTYVRGFFDEELPAGYRYYSVVDYMLGEQ